MKALLITNDFPPTVGGEAAWYGRITASVRPGQVTVLAPHTKGDRSLDIRQSYRVMRPWAPLNSHPMARLVQLMVLFTHAHRIARRERVDIIHLGHLYLGPIGLAFKHAFKIPYLIYLHGGEMAPYLRFRAVRFVVRMIVRDADLIVVNSAYTRRQYEAMGIHHPHTETLTIGVDTDRFHPDLDTRKVRERFGLDGARVILTVGRLIPRKGHDVVIKALSLIRQSVGPLRYLIVGSGPEENGLRALARNLGCSREVIFAGHVPDDELPCFYAASDVFVMPSRALAQRDGVEGFGIVFLEAGACGKPVIGGRSGGMADAVVDGITGVLVDPDDAEELANALTLLLTDYNEAARLGLEGRLRAKHLKSAWEATLTRLWQNG